MKISNAEKQRRWRAKNPKKDKEIGRSFYKRHKEEILSPKQALRRRLNVYGITVDDYNKVFTEQNGKCAICGKHQSELKQSLHIDHCHKTDKTRGLLCKNCNLGIGFFNDDIENLQCAILYLNKER